jgi:ligand-binding sensor domain-containing protein
MGVSAQNRAGKVLPPPSVRFEHLSVEDGLAHSEVFAIAQDHMGFLWFGTQNGLSKYDGYVFKTYRHDPDDEGSLRDNFIESLFVDSEGTLWVGTQDGWLERFNRAEDSFTHYDLSEHIYDITEDADGDLWLGSQRPGLLRFNPKTGEAETIWSALTVRGVDVDAGGRIWAASTESGIVRVDPTTGEIREYRPENTVLDVASTPDGRIWLATFDGGVGVLDPSDGLIRYNMVNSQALQTQGNNSIRKLYVDSEGTLWAGTEEGLDRYDPSMDGFVHLGGPVVMWMHEGPSGRFWLATKDGLYEFDQDRSRFSFIKEGHAWKIMVHEDRRDIVWVNPSWALLSGR